MIDYEKRDAKVAQKIEQLQKAPPDQVERLLGKALRTLFHLGLQEARREADYCQACLGRGIVITLVFHLAGVFSHHQEKQRKHSAVASVARSYNKIF